MGAGAGNCYAARVRRSSLAAVFLLASCRVPQLTPPQVRGDVAHIAPLTRTTPPATAAAVMVATPLAEESPNEIYRVADDLVFAIVGDTRPAYPDDTRSYPTETVRAIWEHVEAEKPRPDFAVGTGDYVFASPFGRQAVPQLDAYLSARAAFANPVYFAMGNHECTGMTASNCGEGTKDGSTRPYVAFLSKMLGPIGVTKPWYSMRVDAKDKSWSAKFVFVAPNAWTEEQAQWLDRILDEETTYTFVVRHEGAHWTVAPGVKPSTQEIADHPLTMSLVGHVHTYRYDAGSRELVVGNGGAPLSTNVGYGYVVAHRRPDGAIEFVSYRLEDHSELDRFAVYADGTPAT